MSIATKVLRADGITVGPDRIRVRLGLPWYRSLPWAGVCGIRVSVDGESLGEPIAVDGRPSSSIAVREDYWSIQEWVQVDFAPTPRVRAGRHASARVQIDLGIPGPLAADGGPMPYSFDHTVDVRLGPLNDSATT